MNKILSDVEQYIFGEFTLRMDGILYYQDKETSLPPKELGVLILLLNSAGVLISKDEILEKVWGGDAVAEESLTRCVYVLRRLLKENKNNRYIDTIYGKGYRFTCPVTHVSPVNERESKSVLAVLPFKMDNPTHSSVMHDFLIQALSKYAARGLNILPSTLTSSCKDYDDIVTLLDKTQPDYYLAGMMITHSIKPSLRIELVRTRDHYIVHRESFTLDENINFSCLSLQCLIDDFLPRYIPCLINGKNAVSLMKESDTAIAYLNGRHQLDCYTPSSVKKALSQFLQCLDKDPNHPLLLTSIAECYLAMANLGLFDKKHAQMEAKRTVIKALSKEPDNALALSLLAILNSINKEHCVADILFQQATSLAPSNAAIHYYHAWHLLLVGRIKEALDAVHISLKLLPTRVASGILKMLLNFINGDATAAIRIGKRKLIEQAPQHATLQSFLAVILAKEEHYIEAIELAEKTKASAENQGILLDNYHYVNSPREHNHGTQKTVHDYFMQNYFMSDISTAAKNASLSLKYKKLSTPVKEKCFYSPLRHNNTVTQLNIAS
ncbi:winged helix-turn-helix domain-containing protein [Candidatus Fukatsuia symbiotica]|uniref:OmpR/PhoB-type domain-containing protein n=1 Tax=Candidatus Fukatsuia symbiotica TaxID=1878942 RepID=A0A2U8I685_9GAMM|nr:winged helix-turn-helix domain-containing protein [Candidatus Fukatsuia symbiotica]AWK14579.1 hypothetical protein CCS41_08985 [Candidatus Fukatsuia symbiotica]MEA9444878.1 winged helix-turn-helix domain-containing protein [Candidatus Fukatsuia symbiotica]